MQRKASFAFATAVYATANPSIRPSVRLSVCPSVRPCESSRAVHISPHSSGTVIGSEKIQLENVAINDVLPLNAARLDAVANIKCFGISGTLATLFQLYYSNSLCGATLFGSHQRRLFPPIWQRLVGFGFRVQPVGSTMQNFRRVGENSDPILF